MRTMWTDEEAEIADAMSLAGAHYEEIAAKLKRSFNSVRTYIRTYNLGIYGLMVDEDDEHLVPSLEDREIAIALVRGEIPLLVAASLAAAAYERPPASLEIDRERHIRGLRREVVRCRKLARRHGWTKRPARKRKLQVA